MSQDDEQPKTEYEIFRYLVLMALTQSMWNKPLRSPMTSKAPYTTVKAEELALGINDL